MLANRSGRRAALAFLLLFPAGLSTNALAAPKAYAVEAPAPSGIKYDVGTPPKSPQISFHDDRSGEELEFSKGTLMSGIEVGGTPINAFEFMRTGLQQELASRGVAVTLDSAAEGKPSVTLRAFRIRNYRASGFSPFVTFTYVTADIDDGTVKKRVGVFVKRAKVPVWSFSEIVDPTFNQPLSIAVKELASKVSNVLYNYRASDATVDGLVAKIAGDKGDDTYKDTYALGFTNNPRAVPKLLELTKNSDEYVRLAAISSLGTLHATDQFGLLKSIYQGSGIWQDKGMALKAIGDLDTAEGKAFLADVAKSMEASSDPKESGWTLAIIHMYQ